MVSPPRPPPAPRRRAAKLPKMNNSERGKYYRQKYKDHELGLERSVVTLRKQLQDLRLFLEVREVLARRNPYDDCAAAVATVFAYFERARDGGVQFEPTFQAGARRMRRETLGLLAPLQVQPEPHTRLRFELESISVNGCVNAPVITMRGMLHTKYTLEAVEHMFPHARDDPQLLDVLVDKDVRYPCTYRFFFGAGGVFYGKIVEADYVHGLQQVLGRLHDVRRLLEGSHSLRKRENSLEDVLRGPSTMVIDYLLS